LNGRLDEPGVNKTGGRFRPIDGLPSPTGRRSFPTLGAVEVKDTFLILLRAMQIELIVFLVFFFGLRSKFSRYWQIRISFGLIGLLIVTFVVAFYFAYSHGFIRY
jgi:hypothetical protein